MYKDRTPSFIVELPFKVSASQERQILSVLESGRQLYNACLGESLKRLSLMRQSKDYQKATSIPKSRPVERKKAFKALRDRFEFKDSAIQSFGVRIKNSCHIKDHLDVHTTQKVATRAFNAVSEHSVSKRGKPRFKGKGQFDSLESKTNKNGIKYRDGWIIWNGLKLECILDAKDKVITHGLSCPIKYCRLVRRKYKGRNLFYAQLVVEGMPYQKYEYGDETVGIDIGPSTIAYVSDTEAEIKQFCEELKPIEEGIRVLQRKLDRQRRANNPDNYSQDGTVKRGRLKWNDSQRYITTKNRLSELHRVQAGQRKSLQGKLANKILRIGKYIKVEDNPYKGFQSLFGKSIGMRAPSLFVSNLIRKAESAGGYTQKIPTKTKLSQICICGREEKKPLHKRWHVCDCGVISQRDLFSAFLSKCVDKNNILDTSEAKLLWRGAEPLLRQAVSRAMQSANGRPLSSSFGISQIPAGYLRQSGSPAKSVGVETEAGNDVDMPRGIIESPGEVNTENRTPCL